MIFVLSFRSVEEVTSTTGRCSCTLLARCNLTRDHNVQTRNFILKISNVGKNGNESLFRIQMHPEFFQQMKYWCLTGAPISLVVIRQSPLDTFPFDTPRWIARARRETPHIFGCVYFYINGVLLYHRSHEFIAYLRRTMRKGCHKNE